MDKVIIPQTIKLICTFMHSPMHNTYAEVDLRIHHINLVFYFTKDLTGNLVM